MPESTVSPVVWYSSAEDFEVIRAASLDAHELPATYAGWLELAERALTQMHRRGLVAFRAEMRAADFIPWCHARRLKINSSARAQYVSLAVADWHLRRARLTPMPQPSRERCSLASRSAPTSPSAT